MPLNQLSLDGTWKLKGYPLGEGLSRKSTGILLVGAPPDRSDQTTNAIDAQLPGSVRKALLANRDIPDPYIETNSLKSLWVEEREWWFNKTFRLPRNWTGTHSELELFLVGHQADVWINAKYLGSAIGMFPRHRIDITSALTPGKTHHITLRLRPPAGSHRSLVDRSFTNWYKNRDWVTPTNPMVDEHLTCRFAFGWDWAPHIFPIGVHGHIRLISFNKVSINDPAIKTTKAVDNSTSKIIVKIPVTTTHKATVTLRGSIKHQNSKSKPVSFKKVISFTKAATKTTTIHIDIPNSRLWWPVGLGKQNLYTLETQAIVNGKQSDSRTTEFGIRTIKMTPNTGQPPANSDNYNWTFTINGKKIFAQGYNWTPADSLLDLPEKKYKTLLTLVKESNAVMLRVWGEGLAEKNEFYKHCNRLGILVWQDTWVGSTSPDMDQSEHHAALRDTIRRLRCNPSLVLWCGGNEFNPANKHRVPQLKAFEEICRQEDNSRPVHLASPWGGNTHGRGGDIPAKPLQHYKQFCAEAGYATAPPPLPQIKRFLEKKSIWPINKNSWYHHNAIVPIWNESLKQLGGTDNIEQYIAFLQFIQERTLRYQLEITRTEKFKISGNLYWSFNVSWPCPTWEVVDWYCQPKQAYYAHKRSAAPLQAISRHNSFILKPGSDFNSTIHIVNDAQTTKSGTVTAQISDLAGNIIIQQAAPFTAPPRSVITPHKITCPIPAATKPGSAFLYRLITKQNNRIIENHYLLGSAKRHLPNNKNSYRSLKSLKPTPPRITAASPKRVTIQNTADSTLLFTHILAPDLPPNTSLLCSDNYFPLLPGQSKTIDLKIIGSSTRLTAISLGAWNTPYTTIKL